MGEIEARIKRLEAEEFLYLKIKQQHQKSVEIILTAANCTLYSLYYRVRKNAHPRISIPVALSWSWSWLSSLWRFFFLDVCYMDKVRTVNTRSIPKLFFWAHFNFRYALDLAKSKVKIQISNSHLNTFEFHLLQIVFHTIQNFNAKVQTCVNRAYFPALHQFNGSSFIQFIIWV